MFKSPLLLNHKEKHKPIVYPLLAIQSRCITVSTGIQGKV